ncbi:MAG: hypothetical protein J1D88_10145 [Treponema sp.]|nr:hypothetical protein [Treponema sp.]
MKNQILLCLLALCSAVVLNAQPMFLSPETITYKVREDTFYSDKAFKEPYRPIKKDSIITWTSEMGVGPIYSADVEAGWYVKYSINASYDENEKPVRMYTDALQVVDSELLTQEKSLIRIIPEYYLEVLSKKDLAMIFEKQPLWLKTLEECRNGKYGSDSLEDIFKPESYLLSNTIVSFSQNNYYLVKNIETIGDCKRLALLRYRDDISESTGLKENVYSDIYKKYQKDAYIDLFIQFDGDYVDLWINSKDDFMGRYIIASDVLREQIHNFMETKDIDLSAITWPRHADGTCDYEDEGGNATAGAGDFEDRLNKGFWVRDYYNEVILTRDRNTILSYVPKYKENPSTFAYELDSEVYWYEESIFDKCEYVFSKIFYTYFLYVFSASFYITDIQRIDTDMYQVVVETDNFSKDEIEKGYNSGCDWQDENIIIERFY